MSTVVALRAGGFNAPDDTDMHVGGQRAHEQPSGSQAQQQERLQGHERRTCKWPEKPASLATGSIRVKLLVLNAGNSTPVFNRGDAS